MIRPLILATLTALAAVWTVAPPALAGAPPADARPLSEIIASLEERDDIAHFDEIEWDDDGYWEIEYYRVDGAKVKIEIDPVTGQARR